MCGIATSKGIVMSEDGARPARGVGTSVLRSRRATVPLSGSGRMPAFVTTPTATFGWNTAPSAAARAEINFAIVHVTLRFELASLVASHRLLVRGRAEQGLPRHLPLPLLRGALRQEGPLRARAGAAYTCGLRPLFEAVLLCTGSPSSCPSCPTPRTTQMPTVRPTRSSSRPTSISGPRTRPSTAS